MGLLFAGLLLVAAPVSLSDNEVEKRARDMGMVYRDEISAFEAMSGSRQTDEETGAKEEKTESKVTGSVEEKKLPDTVTLAIPKGSSTDEVGEQLMKLGIIKDKHDFLAEVQRQKASGKIIAGSYTIPSEGDVGKIVKLLTEHYRP